MKARFALLRLAAPALVACSGALAGCSDREAHAAVDSTANDEAGSGARRVASIPGFLSPESVRYDAELDAFYVSNMFLFGSWKDGNGYLARVNAANIADSRILAQGGVRGVTLNAPKGMAIHGDTLWVADIDVLRAFDRNTGAPLGEVDLTPWHPTLLNDVAMGPDGSIRVTDTGVVLSEVGVLPDTTGDRIFVIGAGRSVRVIAAGAPYPKPNGLTWDAKRNRWLVVTFDDFRSVLYSMPRDDSTRTQLATGRGRWDGVEVLGDGRILVSSWADSSLHIIDGARDTQVIRHVPVPADIGVDTKRNRVAIPVSGLGRVDIWTLPAPR
ncbi:MAG: hypothetical protein JWO05_74 [Gemmatimonadetes bacterium]|nr:hypothetical protein [Gemmatimonadota bacterium]